MKSKVNKKRVATIVIVVVLVFAVFALSACDIGLGVGGGGGYIPNLDQIILEALEKNKHLIERYLLDFIEDNKGLFDLYFLEMLENNFYLLEEYLDRYFLDMLENDDSLLAEYIEKYLKEQSLSALLDTKQCYLDLSTSLLVLETLAERSNTSNTEMAEYYYKQARMQSATVLQKYLLADLSLDEDTILNDVQLSLKADLYSDIMEIYFLCNTPVDIGGGELNVYNPAKVRALCETAQDTCAILIYSLDN